MNKLGIRLRKPSISDRWSVLSADWCAWWCGAQGQRGGGRSVAPAFQFWRMRPRPRNRPRARLLGRLSAYTDLEGGVLQPYVQKLVEALRSGGKHEPIGRCVNGHVGNPRLALAASIASEALTHPRLEAVPHDPGPELVARFDKRSPFFDGRVGVVHHYREFWSQCGLYELPLPPVAVPIVAEKVLADVLVGCGEPLAEERALPRGLQADEDDQLHIHCHVHGSL